MEEIKQWTYVIWDDSSWKVYHQIPDPLWPKSRVISTKIDSGYHDIPWQPHRTSTEYAAKQKEIGMPYASTEWPFRTCEGEIIYPENSHRNS